MKLSLGTQSSTGWMKVMWSLSAANAPAMTLGGELEERQQGLLHPCLSSGASCVPLSLPAWLHPPVTPLTVTPMDCDTCGLWHLWLWHLWLWLWHPPAPRPAGRSCSLVTSQGHQSQRATRTRPEPLQQQTVTHWAGTCNSLHRVKQRCQRGPQTFTALQKSLVLSCLIILQKQFWDPWQTNPSMQRRHMMPRWPLLSSFNTHMFQVYFQLAVKEWGFGVVKILLGRKNPYRCWKKSFHHRRISTKDTLH